jgi:hypothetical protein
VYNLLSSVKYRNKLVENVQSVKQEDGFTSYQNKVTLRPSRL